MKKKTEYYFFIVASILLLLGISGNIYYYFTSCNYKVRRFVKTEIANDKTDKRFYIIYVINNVNQNCGGIPYLEKIKERKDTYIKIYVNSDYSDSDIQNLRETFSIPHGIKIKRMGKEFNSIYKSCIIDYTSGNFKIAYDRKTNKLNIKGGF